MSEAAMQTDRPGRTSGGANVRLSWPGTEADRPVASPPAKRPKAAAKAAAEAAGPAVKGRTAKAAAGRAGKGASSPKAKGPTTASARATAVRVSGVPEAPVALADAPLGRVFVDAFDRLADRLLERLRSMRQDIDADLTAVRSEVAGLRQAVDAIGDRVQVRQLRATIDELHADVIGLRRAVLEWPELDQLSQDVTAVRGDLAFLFATPSPPIDAEQLEWIVSAVADRVVDRLGDRDDEGGRIGQGL
jgi:hypothetical protein